MNEVHEAAMRLESVFVGQPQVDWKNANDAVIADLVTLARDWFERRDSNRQLIQEAVNAMWNLPTNVPPVAVPRYEPPTVIVHNHAPEPYYGMGD